jgi:glutathione S-transferase
MATKRDIPEKWYPKEIRARAQVDEYLEWQHNNTRIACAMFFQTKVLIPKISGKPVDESKLKYYQKHMEKVLGNFLIFDFCSYFD